MCVCIQIPAILGTHREWEQHDLLPSAHLPEGRRAVGLLYRWRHVSGVKALAFRFPVDIQCPSEKFLQTFAAFAVRIAKITERKLQILVTLHETCVFHRIYPQGDKREITLKNKLHTLWIKKKICVTKVWLQMVQFRNKFGMVSK